MPKKARVKKREEHAKSLVMARSACRALAEFAVGKAKVIILGDRQREEVASLIEEFGRLDAKERKQQKEGASKDLKASPDLTAEGRVCFFLLSERCLFPIANG